MVIRDIQEDKKIYSLTAVGNKYLFTKEPESVDKVPLMVDERNIYVDLDDSIKVTQSEFVNKLYLVKGHANRLDWDVEEKLKTYSERPAIRQRSGKTRASRRGLRPKFLLRAPLSDITDCPDLW